MADGNTLYECVTEFLMYLKGVLVLSENTLTSYKCDLEQFMNMPGINRHASIKTVTVENLRQCIGELSRKKRAASSINRFISAFRSLFAYCRKLGYIDVNSAASIKSVKMPKRLPRFMTQAEVDELCNQPAVKELLWEKRDKALFEMMYSSGCRVSEIANLHLSDISADFSQAVVTGKGKKDRIVYFADDARKAMREYIDDRRCRFGPLHLQAEKSFFVNQHGAALEPVFGRRRYESSRFAPCIQTHFRYGDDNERCGCQARPGTSRAFEHFDDAAVHAYQYRKND